MIDIIGNAYGPSGFAQHIRQLLLGLRRIDAKNVRFVQRSGGGSMDLATGETIDAVLHYQHANRTGIPTVRVFITQPPALAAITKGDVLYFPWEPCSLPRLLAVPTLNQRRHFPFQLDWTLACEMASGVIGTSQYCEKVYELSAPNANILGHVYPPVDEVLHEKAPLLTNELLGDKSKHFKVLIVGKWEPRKNIPDTLLGTMLALQSTESVIILKTMISGDAQRDCAHIQKIVFDLKNRQEFSGMQLPPVLVVTDNYTEEQMASLYKTADLLVLASHAEGFGYPAAQALAAGTDVVATNGSALTEILNNDKDRLIDATRAPIVYGAYPFFHASMDWFYPSMEDMIKKISIAYLDHKQIKRKTSLSQLVSRARTVFSPAACATKFMEIMES